MEETHGEVESPYEEGSLSCKSDVNPFVLLITYQAFSTGTAKLFLGCKV